MRETVLAGSIFHTTSGLGGFLGVVSLLFVIPTVFASPLGTLFGNTLLLDVIHLLPTYYMAVGLMNALQHQGTKSTAISSPRTNWVFSLYGLVGSAPTGWMQAQAD